MKKLVTAAKISEVDSVSDKSVLLYNDDPQLQDDAHLKSIIGEVSEVSDQITEAVKRNQVVSNMEEVDMQVESDARTLKTITKGYAAMPDEKISAAAKIVMAVIDKFNYSMFKLPMDQQAPTVDAMIMDLSAEEVKANMALLPTVPDVFAKFIQSQTNFKNKNKEYLQAYADDKDMLSASDLRKQLLQLINGKLVVYLTSAVMMNPEKYRSYVTELEKAIEDVNTQVRLRADRKMKKKNGENA